MKVLHIINSLSTGGAEKLVADSIPLYQTQKITVDVLSLKSEKTEFWKLLETKSSNNITGLTSGSIYNPFLILKIIPFLKKYDLIHVHLFPALYWVVIAKCMSFSRVKLIYTEHSTGNRRRDKVLFKIIDRFIYKKIDLIVCITSDVKVNLEKHLNVFKGLVVINNGIDVNAFSSSLQGDYLFFKPEDFKLIQISSFRKEKDQASIIRSLSLLPEQIKLILVGDGILIEEHKKLVSSLKLDDRVVFLGNRYDITELLNYADVAVLSSNREGFGLAIVEGMAAGLPVIASDIVGIREIVKDYGLLFEKNNEDDLKQEILKLYDDKEFYKKMSFLSLERAKDFDINKMVLHYMNFYKKLLNEA
ncbi:glycosyltransferase [uncultured Nonlabens sp.]|uniref:glycosyltransferase n=1 Tax=uncultured Nonlabens sp. TaxID=859306 RepID=UPI00260EEDE0|nr:glycosyltransferase [uncultured Nonlabens sp.]